MSYIRDVSGIMLQFSRKVRGCCECYAAYVVSTNVRGLVVAMGVILTVPFFSFSIK